MTTITRVRPFDLETTGVEPSTDRIVTAYFGALDADGTSTGRGWMVKPDGFEIPAGAEAVHGVSTARALAEGAPLADVLAELVEAMSAEDTLIAGHNLAYDLSMLAHELERVGHPDPVGFIMSLRFVDTLVLDKFLDKYRRGKRTLTAIAPIYGVELSDDAAHNADSDAIASGHVALAMLARPELRGQSVEQLQSLQRQEFRAQMSSLTNFRRRTDPTFQADLSWPLRTSALELTRPAEVLSDF